MIPVWWRSRAWWSTATAASVLIGCAWSAVAAQDPPPVDPDAPPGFKQMIPRGRIAAVDEPQFVTALEAEIADDAWVLGVAIDGVARAYSLNLLNHHEVVNDRIGDKAIAAVW
jgi:hypothetical protein